jgi:hypothetical protein
MEEDVGGDMLLAADSPHGPFVRGYIVCKGGNWDLDVNDPRLIHKIPTQTSDAWEP